MVIEFVPYQYWTGINTKKHSAKWRSHAPVYEASLSTFTAKTKFYPSKRLTCLSVCVSEVGTYTISHLCPVHLSGSPTGHVQQSSITILYIQCTSNIVHRANSFFVEHICSYGRYAVASGIVSLMLERGLDMDFCTLNLM